MPSNIIFFTQPLFPEGLKLVVEACYSSDKWYVPDEFTELSWFKAKDVEWKPNDHIIVVTGSIWVRYRVI